MLWVDLLSSAREQQPNNLSVGAEDANAGIATLEDAHDRATAHQKAELLHSFQYELLVPDLIDSQILQVLGRQLQQIHAR